MQVTVMIQACDGLHDDNYPPIVYDGHLTLEEATKIVAGYSAEYSASACVPCDESEEAAFYANFAHSANPPRNKDGTIECPSQAMIELWFYHREVVQG